MSRILLVEDDPFAQELVTSILETQGWEVDLAGDAFASLRLLREGNYHAALIDYHLPEMDGYALARLMRDICGARSDRLHLIGMTADRHGLAERRGVDHVFDHILAKPFQPSELMATLAKPPPADAERRKVAEAAAALLAKPDIDRARDAAAAIWRARGLHGIPRVHVVPSPTADQAAAVRICFDIVEQASADFVLILDARGLQELIRSRLSKASHLPTVTLDRALAIVTDAHFAVAESASWSTVAGLVRRSATRETC
jgi:CheY-like chemotaxis protein